MKKRQRKDKKIKVAVLIDAWFPIFGGGQVHTEEISQILSQNFGYDIEIITSNLGIKGTEDYSDSRTDTLKVTRLGPRFSFENFFGRIIYIFYAFFYLISHDFDLIHAHAFLPGIPAKLASKLKKKPVVFTVHGIAQDSFSEMINNKALALFYRWIEELILFRISYDWQITVSNDFLKFKNINKKISLIPNGVDVEKFDKIKTKKNKPFKLIFVGRLHPQKGLQYLLSALAILKNKSLNVYLTLVGDGNLLPTLKKSAIELGILSILLFKGKLSEDKLISEYKSSHLFVLPSIYEGQPLTLLEAWAAKLPVIVTNVGANSDMVENGKNGYLVPPRDPKRLAEIIKKVLEDSKRDLLGENGYLKVKNNFSWEKAAYATNEIYLKVLKK